MRPTYIVDSQGQGGTILREEILQAIPIPDMPEEEPTFTNRVNEIPSGSQQFESFAPTSVIMTSMRAF